jgi:hypothetical protein
MLPMITFIRAFVIRIFAYPRIYLNVVRSSCNLLIAMAEALTHAQ